MTGRQPEACLSSFLQRFDPALLRNYQVLAARVDGLCGQIEERCCEHLVCREGCDSCCRHLKLFWVEAVALAWALKQREPALIARLRQQARSADVDGPCPLLVEGRCLLYVARPLICRTHGLPLLLEREGDRRIDYCPLNFQQATTLPAGAVVDLETLNATLAAVNALFVQELFSGDRPAAERLSIAEALLLPI